MTQQQPIDPRLRLLVDSVFEGPASDETVRELESRLNSDPAAMAYYLDIVDLQAELYWLHRGEAAETASSSGHSATTLRVAPTNSIIADAPPFPCADTPAATASEGFAFAWFANHRGYATAAMAFTVAAVVGGIALRGLRVEETVDRGGIVVAEVESTQDCIWANAREGQTPSSLASGELIELASGVAKLRFASGAVVVVEGPAAIRPLTSISLRLDHGTVAVRADEIKKDFVVVSPDASIVDLGTSFGVHHSAAQGTEVAVFEGTVEVHPEVNGEGCVLGMGSSARVSRNAGKRQVDMVSLPEERFGDLLGVLWDDLRREEQTDSGNAHSSYVKAEFSDGPNPGAVDTFYAAARGRGWLTPWVASGNPLGDIRDDTPLAAAMDPYLRVRFQKSSERTIAREYGARPGFDPSQPHVISWCWRLEGVSNLDDADFFDRAFFYGNPFFRRNSWPTNSWLMGVAGADEQVRARRQVYPGRWFFFDGQEGTRGKEFEKQNMVDTGLTLKPGVVYHFAVVVYPGQARYDAAIRDDETTFVRTGLSFRDRSARAANVLHFGVSTDDPESPVGFSLDSVRVQPLDDVALRLRVEGDAVVESLDSKDAGEPVDKERK